MESGELIEKLQETEVRLSEMENNWKRALADYRNLQKRTEEENRHGDHGHDLDDLEALAKELDHGTPPIWLGICGISIHCKDSIFYGKSQAQTKNQHFCCFYSLNSMDFLIKKFSSPKMQNRQFVFAPKIQYKLVAERSEANPSNLQFPTWCTFIDDVRTSLKVLTDYSVFNIVASW